MTDDLTHRAHTAMPFSAQLGLELISATSDEVVGRAAWAPELCTLGGALHGGFLMSLADSVGATLSSLNLPPGSSGTATVESKTNFFRSVRSGSVTARAVPVHVGTSTMVVQTDISDDNGHLVVRSTQTQIFLR